MTVTIKRPNDTDSLILPLQRTFYPVKIPMQHHQLKNYISTSDPEVIYYASGNEVYALHKSTRKRELIASLPWNPQCLDAAYGWVCVGGSEGGQCAFIFIGDDVAEGAEPARHRHAEVDALLPLDLDPESRLLDQHPSTGDRRPVRDCRRKPEIRYNAMGTSIVNSVAIYRLGNGEPALLKETVVVVTNNDQTVRIFSLTQSRTLAQLHYPTPMNHATISPDQELLVAVGDEPRAFFCKRIRLTSPGETSYANYEWLEIADPKLSLAHPRDACFTTAWSPSGHVCAVASQTGVVTIFDTSRIIDGMEEDEAVIDVLKSSRPVLDHDFCGAVRSMSFAPEPWDLLAWAEDKGRVCVTDLRDAFKSRQTIELETDSPSLNRAVIIDADIDEDTAEQRQMQIEARFLRQEARNHPEYPAAINHTAEYLELAARRTAQRRRHPHEDNDPISEFHGELSEFERQALEAVGRSRLALDEQPTTASAAVQSSRQAENRRESIRQRGLEHSDRTRTGGTRSYQPRRRSSVVISNTNVNNQPSSSHPSNLAPIGTATPTLSASPSRLVSTATASANNAATTPPTFTATEGDPWQTISDAMVPSSTAPTGTSRLRRGFEETSSRMLERQAFQQRPSEALSRYDRLLRASNPHGRLAASQNDYTTTARQTLDSVRALARDGILDGEQLAMARVEHMAGHRPAWRSRRELDGGVGTMGIGWSRDGRNLYVATEEGILEYTVNLGDRKTFPGVALQ